MFFSLEAAVPGDVLWQNPLAAVAPAAQAVNPKNASVEETSLTSELWAVAHKRAGTSQ